MDKKELAVNLLKVFGYINTRVEDIDLLESGYEHLLVEFCDLKFKFTKNDNTWMIESV